MLFPAEVLADGNYQVFTSVYYLQSVAMNLVVGVDYLSSVWTDPDHCTFLRVEFHPFFPSLQCRQILLEKGRVLTVFDVSISSCGHGT